MGWRVVEYLLSIDHLVLLSSSAKVNVYRSQFNFIGAGLSALALVEDLVQFLFA